MKIGDIQNFIDSFSDYDIRDNRNSRYVDQKCTPDIVSFIADCILSTRCANNTFTVKDLWDEEYFISNCRVIFGKPSPSDPYTQNEYNKVLSQPLKLLAYAHVLNVSKDNGSLRFSVQNTEILEYISTKERFAYNFLLVFFTKVLKDSGIYRFFDEYEQNCKEDISSAKAIIYDKYYRFISANTPSQSKTDIDRMFHKVFNVIAFSKGLPGSKGELLNWYDLMYNRVNWRDLSKKKKNETRAESSKAERKRINQSSYIDYQVAKAIRMIRKIQGDKSEVNDELSAGRATEVHHIFPRSKFPTIASMFENLILLTSSQHHQKAHPNGNTQFVNKDYQLICLLAKSQTIENYIKTINGGFYHKEDFIYVINTGLTEDKINNSAISFDGIRKYLIGYYQMH